MRILKEQLLYGMINVLCLLLETLKKEATSASAAESSPVNSEETAMFADVEEVAKETAEN